MHVRVGTDKDWNDGLDSISPLQSNQTTNVRLEVDGPIVILYLNNTQDNFVVLKGVRSSGQATFYVSNPWHTPALASIGSIQMTPLIAMPPVKPSDFNGPLSRVAAFEENVIVPENYSLTFNITPTGTTSDWSSIIHYSGDKSDAGPRGRMPGIICLKSN